MIDDKTDIPDGRKVDESFVPREGSLTAPRGHRFPQTCKTKKTPSTNVDGVFFSWSE